MAIGLLLSSSTGRPLEVTSWPFGVTDSAAPRVYASLPFLACVALLFFYEINKPMESRIELELAQRRAASGAPA